MENEKEPKKEPEPLPGDVADAPIPKLSEMVDRAEKANKEGQEILKRQEDLAARNLLGGTTDAGEQTPKKEEETPLEYAKRISSGLA